MIMASVTIEALFRTQKPLKRKKNVNENKVIVDIQVNKSNVKYMFCI